MSDDCHPHGGKYIIAILPPPHALPEYATQQLAYPFTVRQIPIDQYMATGTNTSTSTTGSSSKNTSGSVNSNTTTPIAPGDVTKCISSIVSPYHHTELWRWRRIRRLASRPLIYSQVSEVWSWLGIDRHVFDNPGSFSMISTEGLPPGVKPTYRYPPAVVHHTRLSPQAQSLGIVLAALDMDALPDAHLVSVHGHVRAETDVDVSTSWVPDILPPLCQSVSHPSSSSSSSSLGSHCTVCTKSGRNLPSIAEIAEKRKPLVLIGKKRQREEEEGDDENAAKDKFKGKKKTGGKQSKIKTSPSKKARLNQDGGGDDDDDDNSDDDDEEEEDDDDEANEDGDDHKESDSTSKTSSLMITEPRVSLFMDGSWYILPSSTDEPLVRQAAAKIKQGYAKMLDTLTPLPIPTTSSASTTERLLAMAVPSPTNSINTSTSSDRHTTGDITHIKIGHVDIQLIPVTDSNQSRRDLRVRLWRYLCDVHPEKMIVIKGDGDADTDHDGEGNAGKGREVNAHNTDSDEGEDEGEEELEGQEGDGFEGEEEREGVDHPPKTTIKKEKEKEKEREREREKEKEKEKERGPTRSLSLRPGSRQLTNHLSNTHEDITPPVDATWSTSTSTNAVVNALGADTPMHQPRVIWRRRVKVKKGLAMSLTMDGPPVTIKVLKRLARKHSIANTIIGRAIGTRQW